MRSSILFARARVSLTATVRHMIAVAERSMAELTIEIVTGAKGEELPVSTLGNSLRCVREVASPEASCAHGQLASVVRPKRPTGE